MLVHSTCLMAAQTGARSSNLPGRPTGLGKGKTLQQVPRKARVVPQALPGSDTLLQAVQAQAAAEPQHTSILQAALLKIQPLVSEATASTAWNNVVDTDTDAKVGRMVQPLLETANASVTQVTRWLASGFDITHQLTTNLSERTSQDLDISMQALAGNITHRVDAATELLERTMPGSDKYDPATVQELAYSMLSTVQHWARTFQELMAPSLFGSWDLNMMFFVSFSIFTYVLLFRAPRQ